VTEPAAGDLRIRQLDDADRDRWDRFVDGHPEATFFHRAGWKTVIERSFGHRTFYLFAERGGAIEGVLPLTHVKSPIFGSHLISNAFCVYGGPVARSEAALNALDAAALEVAEAQDADFVEYRSRAPRPRREWSEKSDLYATFRKPIHADPEQNMLAIPRKQRAMVRKGLKFELAGEIDPEPSRLYRLYAESVRNLGTPVFSRRYFEALKDEFGDACELLVVTHRGQPVSGVMSFYFRDEVLPYYGGGGHAAREVAANDFMYWEVMRRACARGVRVFDFGRSKRGTGAFDFKKNWGFAPEPLHHQFRLRKLDKVPEINPLNPKYRVFIALWKRLPLPIANAIGPAIVRNLG
jgi:FemAB-related protein (PEP-CTERM system-associated)